MDGLGYASFASALAGLGFAGFLAMAVAILPGLRTPRVTALAVGLLSLCLASCLQAYPHATAFASTRAAAVSAPFDALVAPALYLHVSAVLQPGRRPSPAHALLPLLAAATAVWAWLAIGDDLPADPALMAPGVLSALIALALVSLAATVGQGAYILIARRRLAQAAPETDAGALRWVRRAIAVSAALWGISVLAIVAGLAGLLDDGAAKAVELTTTPALYLFGLAYLADRSGAAAALRRYPEAVAPLLEKYRKSALPEDAAAALVARAARALDRDRLFADPTLSLARLAAATGAKPNELSQALNRCGAGYADFVARRRVAEACRLLDDRDGDLSVLAVAMEVGFNAKSTFHTAFQRVTGMSPTAWRRRPGGPAETGLSADPRPLSSVS